MKNDKQSKDTNQNASMRENALKAEALLKMLANVSRLLCLCSMAEGKKSVTELTQETGISQSAVSQHLAKLRQQGFITPQRDKQTIYYSITSKEVEALMATLYDLYCK
jgi:DNA-binding transcriptional ArsR family regulator